MAINFACPLVFRLSSDSPVNETPPNRLAPSPQFADRLLSGVLRLQGFILLLVLGLTVLAVRQVWLTEFTPSIAESFVDTNEEYEAAVGLETWFEGNPDSLIYVGAEEGDELWTASKLLAIRQAADEITNIESIKSVTTIADLPVFQMQQSGVRAIARRSALSAILKKGETPKELPTVEAVLPRRISNQSDWSDEKRQKLSRWLAGRKQFAERLVSRDGQSHLMLIEVDNPHLIALPAQAELIADIGMILERHQIGSRGLHWSGMLTLQAASMEQIYLTLTGLLPSGALTIAVMVLVLFRRLEPIVCIAVVASIAVLWGVGFGEWVYGSFSVLTMAVPLMVAVISTGDIIHLLSAYSADMNKGCSHEVALRKTFGEMASACALTSLTTFIGFASLGLVPSQTIRQFGISAAVGVASALILSVVLVPIILNALHRAGWTLRAVPYSSRKTVQFAEGMARIGMRAPKTVCLLFAGLLLAGLVSGSRIQLDPDVHHRFRSSHPIAQSTDYFIQQFGGVNSVELVLTGSSTELLSPETFRSMRELSRTYLRDLPVSRVDSIADVVGEMLSRIDYNSVDGIPESDQHAVALVNFAGEINSSVTASLVASDRSALRMVVQVPATSYLELRRLNTEILDRARRELPATIAVQEKGSAPLIGSAVEQIILGHMYGFAVSFVMILLIISIGLRSLRFGLIAIPPNLIPLATLGLLLSWHAQVADSDILGVATLGLGLAVDDTIHFLSRYRREFRASSDREAAIASTMHHAGAAIVRTTMILVVGFLPFAFSDYWSINMLGTYLVAILAVALLADLLLLPALVELFAPREERRS